jgi:MOSC domain-containing protein YiiM
MQTAAKYLSTAELESGLAEVIDSPPDNGRLEKIFIRPAVNERRSLDSAALTVDGGIEGDRWSTEASHRTSDGRPDPQNQITLMNARILRQISGDADAMCLAGDNLIVDLDLSEANLPAGSRLAVGREVVVQINALPHTGCGKFTRRYGAEARTFVNSERGTELQLRGRHGSVIQGGTITVGDSLQKMPAS